MGNMEKLRAQAKELSHFDGRDNSLDGFGGIDMEDLHARLNSGELKPFQVTISNTGITDENVFLFTSALTGNGVLATGAGNKGISGNGTLTVAAAPGNYNEFKADVVTNPVFVYAMRVIATSESALSSNIVFSNVDYLNGTRGDERNILPGCYIDERNLNAKIVTLPVAYTIGRNKEITVNVPAGQTKTYILFVAAKASMEKTLSQSVKALKA